MSVAMSFSPISHVFIVAVPSPRNQPETSFRAGDHVQWRFQPMTKIRTSAYAVRCRVPSDHRHPGGARTYNDNSGQALFEHRIVDGLPIVKRQFSRETRGGATVVPHGRRSHRNSLRPLQPLGGCARKREGEGRKKVKGEIFGEERKRERRGRRREIRVEGIRDTSEAKESVYLTFQLCLFPLPFFPPFHFHVRPIFSYVFRRL